MGRTRRSIVRQQTDELEELGFVDAKGAEALIRAMMEYYNTVNDDKLDKGDVSVEYDTAKKIEDKIKDLSSGNDFLGIINNEATLNQAKGNGWYKVNDYQVNGMYGYGFLYAYSHEQTTQQIFFSHRGGIAWRQDWNSNISAATWQKIGADADEVIAKIMGITYGGVLNNSNQKEKGKCYYDTANKKIFKCIENTTVNNANAEYFYPISNNDISELQRKCLTSEVVYRCYEYKAQSGKKLQFNESRANRMLQTGWAAFLRIVIYWGGGNGQRNYFIDMPGHSEYGNHEKFERDGTTCTISWILHNSMRVTFEGKNANTSWVSLVEIISRIDMDGTMIGDIGQITNA